MSGMHVTVPQLKQLEQIRSVVVTVNSPETKTAAQEFLVKIRSAAKQLAKDIKELKAPFQAAIKQVDVATKEWKELLDRRDMEVEQAILAYNRKVEAEIQAANRKAIEKFEKKVEKAEEKAIQQGKPLPFVAPPQLHTSVQKTETVGDAKVTTTKRKAWRLESVLDGDGVPFTPDTDTLTARDAKLYGYEIPLEYFVLDTTRIGKVVRAGGTVPGIVVYEDESIAVRG